MTARLSLPFSMGTYGSVDPDTYEHSINHPVLDIGSSQSWVKTHIQVWLVNHYGHDFTIGFDGNDYYIDFPTEADIAWFKLRWL